MIKPKFTSAQLKQEFDQRNKLIQTAIVSRLQYIGETFIVNARTNGTYNDLTGNLRSSIGYIILKSGKTIKINFPGVNPKGHSRGKSHAKRVGNRYPVGYVLIVVAGMEYAAAVESRGKDVLTGSSIIAKNDLQKAFGSVRK